MKTTVPRTIGFIASSGIGTYLTRKEPSMSHHMQHESRQIGTTTIHVQDDEFFNGYQAGVLLYHVQGKQAGFTDTEIYTFICRHSQSVQTTDRYRAGCISGWFAALYGYHQQPTSAAASLDLIIQERSTQA